MFIHFDAERPSDSPFIERVWSCHSEAGAPFLAVASTHWEFVVSRVTGNLVHAAWLFGVYVGVLPWAGLVLREPRLRALLLGAH